MQSMMSSPRWPQQRAHEALCCPDPASKVQLASTLHEVLESESCPVWSPTAWAAAERLEVPGRPESPSLVPPSQVPRRRLGSEAGRIALIHAIAHIEFNAINLALDAMYRFTDMPAEYYLDWARVAADESRHFSMLSQRLEQLGSCYGAMPAHNGLWEMALKTDDDCLSRMALVPRVLEARGLDVTPDMIIRLQRQGDYETVSLLEIILEEEVAHVRIGTRWFHHCCKGQSLEPDQTFMRLLSEHMADRIRPPLNDKARRLAGFSEQEMTELHALIE